MVGNDVVDLADADARIGARHPRFDKRAFAPGERRGIEAAGGESSLRWILWAAKESAFKVAKQHDSATVFSPSRFVVELDGALRGRVRHGKDVYPVRVTRRGDYVHAVATGPRGDPERVLAGVRRVAGDADGGGDGALSSRAVRAFAVAEIAPRIKTPADSMRIERRGRIPRLVHRDGRHAADVSLSHHGRFIAYACALPRTPGPR